MSWVFLAGDSAFKMKKPVCYPALDFSTLDAREHACREELRLNARLARGVYQGLLALQFDGREGGRFSLVPDGQPRHAACTVEWLVLMRRLPRHLTLLHAIAERSVGPSDIAALAAVLADFYLTADVAPLTPDEYVAGFERELSADRGLLHDARWPLRGATEALDGFSTALERNRPALKERVTRQRIVEGHGDLRPEHVFLLSPPLVIDCLEFNARLRQVDPFDELAFIGMECALAGAPWIGPQLMHACAFALNDPSPPPLIQLYTAHRALLRARLSIAHLLDAKPLTPEKWLPRTQRYVDAALQALGAPHIITATTTRGFP